MLTMDFNNLIASLPSYHWNWSEFCGSPQFTIWSNNHQDLSYCFQMLCLQLPVLSLIAILSAFYAGKYQTWVVRTFREKCILRTRMVISFLLCVAPAVRLVILVMNDSNSLFAVNYLVSICESMAWLVHTCYVSALKHRLGLSLRGPVVMLSLWTLLYLATILRLRSIYFTSLGIPSEKEFVSMTFSAIVVTLQTLYALTLIPSEDSPSRRNTIDIVDQNDVAFRSSLSQYVRFREDFDHLYLGTAMEGSGIWSRFLFWWVNPLIEKGAQGELRQTDDMFDLPNNLTADILYYKLGIILNSESISLLRALHRRFAKQFYCVGLLKFVADLSAFVSPILLKVLIEFIEDLEMPVFYGYMCAVGIFLATLVNSFCTVHFDFLAGKINLKLQSSLISLIYRKILCLNPSAFKDISVGEIVNHVSVDMDRISNSCISFHTVWSIPLKLGLTLYLLYTQIGIAFLAGLGFSIFMILVNKVIASKIGSYSSRMMSAKDRRVEIMFEVLKGIRVIKLNVWEEFFTRKVLQVRANEMKCLKYLKYLDALCVYFWATTPVVISLLTFTFYVYLGGELKASVIFTSLALLNMLIVPLNAFPWVLNGIVEAWISAKRVNTFLKMDELDLDKYYGEALIDTKTLTIKDGCFSWTDDWLHLKDINLNVTKGQLIGICGPVGSGKSSLLSAILGEIQKVSGEVRLQVLLNGIGYVSQTPWIQQGTVRENILFGKPYDAARYRAVIDACALGEDFFLWTKGDFEMVGESGTTLSGGQKARIALARAVYQDADFYLLDDILSAVDVHVAAEIFDNCIKKLLHGKTRILVTHSVSAYIFVDWLLMMENGGIVKQGPPACILDNMHEIDLRNAIQTKREEKLTYRLAKRRESLSDMDSHKEVSASGGVSKKVYLRYWRSVGPCLGLFIIALVAAMQISRIAVDWWLSVWVTTNTDRSANITDFYYLNSLERTLIDEVGSDIDYFIRIYTAIGILNSIVVIMRAFFFAYGGIRAATVVHKHLLQSITRAPMEFFEISPLGRILNRFSSDTNTVDDALPFDLNILLANFAAVLGIILTTIYGMPWLCLFVAPLMPVYHWLQNNYRLTSRDLKRLVSVTLSPLYSHINETIAGLPCIRAFRVASRFTRETQEKIDNLQKCNISSLAASMWLNIRLQMIGVCVVASVSLIAVLQRHFDVVHSGFVGLALTYALTLTSSLGSVVNIFVETERKMVAMERVSEYIDNVEAEVSSPESEIALPFGWIYQGVVSFMNVRLQYRGDLNYALKDVNFETLPAEKIGIVGRTGSGKSSLFAVLFRTPNYDGNISIDAVNIANVPLKVLRSKLTIIPQDPFLFSDTVRKNLDPSDEHDPADILDAINKCNISPLVSSLGGLDGHLQNGGSNLSAGERQLLCLTRAVLRSSKVVCIDEATASIDHETDEHIQEVIKNAFRQSTVFTIAHRVQTVRHCDRIIFMDHGEIVEFDRPQVLLENPESRFTKLVNGETNSSSS